MSGMIGPLFPALALFAATALPALAQVAAPAPPYYAMDPRSPLTPRAASPVQQQVLENYRSQLLQTQRELQQSPPGPGQVELNRRLNGLGPGYSPPAVAIAPPALDLGVVPSPPFNAAPRP